MCSSTSSLRPVSPRKSRMGRGKTEEYVNAGGDDSRVGHGIVYPVPGRSGYGSIEQYTALGTELTKFHIFMVLRI